MRTTITARPCAVLAVLMTAAPTAADAQSETRLAPANGAQIEYAVSGPDEGETVLLIHGGIIAGTFRPLMTEPALADYRLIRYHRRGYAGSSEHTEPTSVAQQAADAAALLRHLGIERAHVVAHSAGGVIAVELAASVPQLVQSLVLLEAGPLLAPEGSALRGPPTAAEPPSFMVLVQQGEHERAVQAFMEAVGGPGWRTRLERAGPNAFQQAVEDIGMFFDNELLMFDAAAPVDYYSRISQPTLSVIGTESRIPATVLELPAVLIPHAETRVLAGIGHSMQTQDPARIAEVVADFIAMHSVVDAGL